MLNHHNKLNTCRLLFNIEQNWESEREKLEEKMRKIEGELEDSKTRLIEFEVRRIT